MEFEIKVTKEQNTKALRCELELSDGDAYRR
jgi:hypothetical protein